MKPIIITLLYLTTMCEIKMTSFEIHTSCETWYHYNVKVTERKQRKLFSNLYYHEHDGKQVVGYVCDDDPPQ